LSYNLKCERFETESGVYTLSEFQHDYYNMDFEEFDEKLHAKLGCRLSSDGYVVYRGSKFPVKNIAQFANSSKTIAKKYANDFYSEDIL
jgi:hypothetical protein